jgi:hypothetical protein
MVWFNLHLGKGDCNCEAGTLSGFAVAADFSVQFLGYQVKNNVEAQAGANLFICAKKEVIDLFKYFQCHSFPVITEFDIQQTLRQICTDQDLT